MEFAADIGQNMPHVIFISQRSCRSMDIVAVKLGNYPVALFSCLLTKVIVTIKYGLYEIFSTFPQAPSWLKIQLMVCGIFTLVTGIDPLIMFMHGQRTSWVHFEPHDAISYSQECFTYHCIFVEVPKRRDSTVPSFWCTRNFGYA